MALAQEAEKSLGNGTAPHIAESQGTGHGREKEIRIADGRERNERDAIGEGVP
jgi:hypothetical protein